MISSDTHPARGHSQTSMSDADAERASACLVLGHSPLPIDQLFRDTTDFPNEFLCHYSWNLTEVSVQDKGIRRRDGSLANACLRKVQLSFVRSISSRGTSRAFDFNNVVSNLAKTVLCQARVEPQGTRHSKVESENVGEGLNRRFGDAMHFAPSDGNPDIEDKEHDEVVAAAQVAENALVFVFDDELFQPSGRGRIQYSVFSINAGQGRSAPILAHCSGEPFPTLAEA